MFLEGSWLDGVKEFLSIGHKADGRVMTVDVVDGRQEEGECKVVVDTISSVLLVKVWKLRKMILNQMYRTPLFCY